MKKKLALSFMILFVVLFSGCGDKKETRIYFESYNKLENSMGSTRGDDYTFEVDNKRYEVMNGYTAEHLQIIDKDENNGYKLIMADSDSKEIFSVTTEKEYEVKAVRECTDTDGKVYILYSKWDTMNGKLSLKDLKSTQILEMDMNRFNVKKQHDFGVLAVVLTVNNGYVYTMEDGRVYRKLINETGNRECMADLGFRGVPDGEEIAKLIFRTEPDGIKVIAAVPVKVIHFINKKVVLSDIKYTDKPMESK
ncbi:hypothetical protein EDD76_10188 [Kineothrix alysoides]|uniref:DUF5050 domain-containing protein n=1 Tax=Kineothrix alysoides TaxID=1469948 RepID=A0A4R1R617_9FIRM|nr:hypothetical protein [Kineothrix alysoides]TCL60991.1 hypothetical protein EDD76_10188 [Kineothrix alysoides]